MKPQGKASISANVSRVVRILMGRDDLKQTDLAKIIGYDESTVTRSLKNQRKWSIDDIPLLAEAFEVSPGLFFTDSDTLVRMICFSNSLAAA